MSLNLSRPAHDTSRSARRLYWQQVRAAIPEPQRRLADKAIAHALEGWMEEQLASCDQPMFTVGVYWPIRGEPELVGLWERWLAGQVKGKRAGQELRLALPVVRADAAPLSFVPWACGDALQTDRFGARVPAHGLTEVQPDALVIPCVAFRTTAAGIVRLGYGGGFYDRTLAQRRYKTVALAYRCLEDQTLEAAAHDLLLDRVITEV